MKASTFFLLMLFFFTISSTTSADTYKSFLQCLGTHSQDTPSISQVIYTPESPKYESVLNFSIQDLRYASDAYPKPQIIVTPVEESQIKTVITCSKTEGLPIRVRGGGHDFEGLSYTSPDPFVMIDMINLRSIDVTIENDGSGTAWVGAGASTGELYYRIAEKSKTLAFPGGVWETVGITGFISGGGYGSLKRKYGLGGDNVLDARIMDSHGNILDRKAMGEDLFWAIRGGGASSFGVVLSWNVNLVAVPEIVTIFSISRTLEQNANQIVHKWQSVAPHIDRDLYLRIQYFVQLNEEGKKTIRASFESLFLGRVDRLIKLLQEKLPELGLTTADCEEMPWVESAVFFAGDAAFPWGRAPEILLNRTAPPRAYFKAKSDYVRTPIPVSELEHIWQRFFEVEDGAPLILMTPYGGKMDEYSETALPFPHRNGTLYMMYTGVSWNETTTPETEAKLVNFLRNFYADMAAYVSKNPREAYINYNDLDIGVGSSSYEEASVWGARYFKEENFKKLIEIKTKVDPDNFFNHPQSIPPWTSFADKRDEL